MANQFGTFVVGNFKGYFEKENGKFTNRFLGVVVGTYDNKFDETQENVIEISVSEDQAKNHSQDWEKIIGRPVSIKVGQSVRSGVSGRTGKPYAFLNTFLLKDANVQLVATGK